MIKLFTKKSDIALKTKAVEYLKDFLDTAFVLENTKVSTMARDTKEWYELLDKIGSSISTLYKFHSFLIENHSYFKDKPYEKQLCSFYMDMFISKIKHTFFTEYPQLPLNELSQNKASGIYINALKLFEDIDENELTGTLFLFYYKIFLFYDFVYDKETKRGKFTSFKTDINKAKKTIELLKELLDSSNNLKAFRENLSKIVPNTLAKQLGLKHTNSSEIYNSFLANDTHKIEPLSYFTIFKIWKISKFLQDKFEELEKDDFNEFESIFLEKTKEYIVNLSNIIEETYSQNRSTVFTQNTYKLDKDYMQNIIYKYVHQKEIKDLNKKIENFNIEIPAISDKKIKKDDIKKVIEENILIKCNNLTEPWKFNRIFEKASKYDILGLSYTFYSLIKERGNTFVGLYKSGALLAHILNICAGCKENVYLFTTFPYVAIHPRSYDIRDENKSFVLVDENYKTGFTSAIAKEYINRKTKHRLDILSLIVNNDYKQIEGAARTLGTIKDDTLSIFDIATVSSKDISAFFEYIKNNYDKYTNSSFLEKFITISVDGRKEYDITRILSNTVVLFSVAYSFLEKLDKTKKNVFFQSPTDSSRLIAEAIAYTSKVIGDDKFSFYFKYDQERASCQNIFIDLSIDSGFTKEYSTSRDIKEDFNYDKTFVIANLSNKSEKIDCLITREKNV